MRWNSCNILQTAPDARRLWQFDAKGGGFVLAREQRVPLVEKLPAKFVAKNWSSLWQPKLNIAWLPPENIFLRVIDLPASNAAETLSMVEFQLEKLSPLPVNQVVWTMHTLGTRDVATRPDAAPEKLQTVIVVIVARNIVEEFLGRLEADGFLADRLEVPMLDALEAINATDDGAWFFQLTIGGQNAALVAWWFDGVLRNLSFITLPADGDRAGELKNQIAHITWAGELEGWLTAQPKWHVVADAANATEWENNLRNAIGETVHVIAPPLPAELAARTAKRAASAEKSNLLPAEFSTRYHQQFVDRLWLRGLFYAGGVYAVGLLIYFCLIGMMSFSTQKVERAVSQISNDYTNALQLKARYAVLKERQELKYAALDTWQVLAQELPPGISLARSSFTDGKKLSLNGQIAADDSQKLIDFYDSLRKAKLNGQPIFDPSPATGDQLVYRQQGATVFWNFALQLLHAEADQP